VIQNNGIKSKETGYLMSHCYDEITLRAHYMHIRYITLLFLFGIIGGIYRDAPLDWMLIAILGLLSMQVFWWRRYRDEQELQDLHLYEDGIKLGGEDENSYAWSDLMNVRHFKPYDNSDKKPGLMLEFSNGREIYVLQRINDYGKLYVRLREFKVPGTEKELVLYSPMDQYGRALSPTPKIDVAVPAQD
jgi:hypothetical protein